MGFRLEQYSWPRCRVIAETEVQIPNRVRLFGSGGCSTILIASRRRSEHRTYQHRHIGICLVPADLGGQKTVSGLATMMSGREPGPSKALWKRPPRPQPEAIRPASYQRAVPRAEVLHGSHWLAVVAGQPLSLMCVLFDIGSRTSVSCILSN
jgi:hypothetical protein